MQSVIIDIICILLEDFDDFNLTFELDVLVTSLMAVITARTCHGSQRVYSVG